MYKNNTQSTSSQNQQNINELRTDRIELCFNDEASRNFSELKINTGSNEVDKLSLGIDSYASTSHSPSIRTSKSEYESFISITKSSCAEAGHVLDIFHQLYVTNIRDVICTMQHVKPFKKFFDINLYYQKNIPTVLKAFLFSKSAFSMYFTYECHDLSIKNANFTNKQYIRDYIEIIMNGYLNMYSKMSFRDLKDHILMEKDVNTNNVFSGNCRFNFFKNFVKNEYKNKISGFLLIESLFNKIRKDNISNRNITSCLCCDKKYDDVKIESFYNMSNNLEFCKFEKIFKDIKDSQNDIDIMNTALNMFFRLCYLSQSLCNSCRSTKCSESQTEILNFIDDANYNDGISRVLLIGFLNNYLNILNLGLTYVRTFRDGEDVIFSILLNKNCFVSDISLYKSINDNFLSNKEKAIWDFYTNSHSFGSFMYKFCDFFYCDLVNNNIVIDRRDGTIKKEDVMLLYQNLKLLDNIKKQNLNIQDIVNYDSSNCLIIKKKGKNFINSFFELLTFTGGASIFNN